uniref:2-oxoglutarate and iron-dependent oxygenase domain containing 1 n=1 Tax=Scleropages formosus TaxID=113540 RepID=A0A8C9VY50_SCLFO
MTSKRRKNDTETVGTGKKKDKREETPKISEITEDTDVRDRVKVAWLKKEHLSHGSIELDCRPFPHCVIKNFIRNEGFLENLEKELLDLNFHEKSNDLYKFKQSDDLKKRKEAHIAGLRAVLFERFRLWLSSVFAVELEPVVDVSCAKYEYTDVLLCHDDELEGRRIAFILYLVRPWESSDGGTLDLYSVDGNNQPKDIVKSLVPSWNTLIFFEVSPVSFHQEELLLEWINPIYLDVAYQAQVQEEFEESSEILLKNFLKEDKFEQVNEALKQSEIQWVKRGPPNKRSYRWAEQQGLPPCVSACWELLSSEAFFLLLSNFTGLKLHFMAAGDDTDEEEEEKDEERAAGSTDPEPRAAPERQKSEQEKTSADLPVCPEPSTPLCRGELRCWGHGDYTLIHDTNVDSMEFALDLLLYFGCEGWQADFGGFTSYIASGEDEELLTVSPESNSVALVYRDKETLKFVKHVNHRSLELERSSPRGTSFYDFSFVYYE